MDEDMLIIAKTDLATAIDKLMTRTYNPDYGNDEYSRAEVEAALWEWLKLAAWTLVEDADYYTHESYPQEFQSGSFREALRRARRTADVTEEPNHV